MIVNLLQSPNAKCTRSRFSFKKLLELTQEILNQISISRLLLKKFTLTAGELGNYSSQGITHAFGAVSPSKVVILPIHDDRILIPTCQFTLEYVRVDPIFDPAVLAIDVAQRLALKETNTLLLLLDNMYMAGTYEQIETSIVKTNYESLVTDFETSWKACIKANGYVNVVCNERLYNLVRMIIPTESIVFIVPEHSLPDRIYLLPMDNFLGPLIERQQITFVPYAKNPNEFVVYEETGMALIHPEMILTLYVKQ